MLPGTEASIPSKSMIPIAYSPYFHKIYKYPPFPQNVYISPVFLQNLWFFA